MSKNRELENDGVQTVKYTLENLTKYPLYTKMEIFIHPPPLKKSQGWFEKLTKGFQETQNNFVNRMVEKFNELGDEQLKEEEIKKMKVYY